MIRGVLLRLYYKDYRTHLSGYLLNNELYITTYTRHTTPYAPKTWTKTSGAIAVMSNIVLTTISDALLAFKEFTGDADVQTQAVQTFLMIATRSSPSVEDISKVIGLNQSTASRNIKKLAVGPRAQEGYGLVIIELDPYDGRRRILKLSTRGHELVKLIETRTMLKLRRHFKKEAKKPE